MSYIPMKTIIIGDKRFEIIDDAARNEIEGLKQIDEVINNDIDSLKQADETIKADIKNIKDDIKSLDVGDMLKSTYDIDNDGVIDNATNAENLNGQPASYYATKDDLGNVQSSVNNINESLGTQVTYVLEGTTLTITTK